MRFKRAGLHQSTQEPLGSLETSNKQFTGIKHCKRWFLFAIVQDTPEAGVQEQATQDR